VKSDVRRAAAAIAVLGILAFLAPSALAQAPSPVPTPRPTPGPGSPPGLAAAAAILIDLDSSDVLFARHIHARRAPASLTKVITALVANDLYEADETVKISPLVMGPGGSRLGVEPGTKLKVRELLYGLLLKSGNDAAVALAAHDPAGYRHFLALMNAKARSLGAYDSQFRNPHGLDEPGHYTSAWDMALLSRELMAQPLLADLVATEEHAVHFEDGTVRTFDNHNKLIGSYPGAIGVKTGFTNNAGNCLVAAAALPTGRFLTVVMGSPNHYGETRSLFSYGSALNAAQTQAVPEPAAQDPGPRLASPPRKPVVPLPAPPMTADVADPRWAAAAAMLAAAMLATLVRAKPRHPLREAAALHAYLEPLVPREPGRNGARAPARGRPLSRV
jgi:serine-type D-Ala-D-Ala carboxypeptidase (penicillin-binding protein 5/6)